MQTTKAVLDVIQHSLERYTGEPDAVKAARPVRRGAIGTVTRRGKLACCLPYHTTSIFLRYVIRWCSRQANDREWEDSANS